MENADQSAERKPEPVNPRRPLWVRFVHYAIRRSRESKANKKPESSADKAARRTAQATIAIAFFTLVLVVVSYFQWREIHRGGPDTTKIATAAGQIQGSANRSANAAHDFAVAAQGIETKIGIAEGDFAQMAQNSADSIKASRSAMQQDQRAWVGIKDITMSHPLTKDTDINFGINAVNTGKTPALDVELVKMSVGLSENRPNKTVIITDRDVIAPNNNEVFYGTSKSPSSQLIAALNAKTVRFYLRGRIEYRDIFHKPHITLFCGYYPGNGGSLNFFNCSKGNSMN